MAKQQETRQRRGEDIVRSMGKIAEQSQRCCGILDRKGADGSNAPDPFNIGIDSSR